MNLKCYPDSNGIKDLLTRTNYISRKPLLDFYTGELKNAKGSFLDFGCGNMPYKSLFKKAEEYVGLDVDLAKDYGFSENGVTYYDGRTIPFDDEKFDNVISAQVFEHIPDLDYSLSEIHRVLRKDGTLCFSVPMAYPVHFDPYDFRRFTSYGIEKMLISKGFKDIVIKGSNRPIDTVRFLKICSTYRCFNVFYTAFANICFLNGLKGERRLLVKLENFLRKMCGKKPKPDDKLSLPLDYLVICRKK